MIAIITLAALGCSSSSSATHDVSQTGGQAGATAGGSTSGGDAGDAGADASGGSNSGSGGANSGGSSGGPPSDCPLDCLPPAPASWTGPSAVYDGPEAEQPDTCPDVYSLEEVTAHQGMAAEPAMCSCGPGGVSGEQCVATVTRYVDAACSPGAANPTDYVIPAVSNCISVQNAIRLRIAPSAVDLAGASCSFDDPTAEVPAPTFERVNLACGLPVTAACEGRPDCTAAPLPNAPFGRLCIHKQGDHPCPDAGYGARFLAYQNIDDTRDCGACSGAPLGGTCGDPNASVVLHQDAACMQPVNLPEQRNVCFEPSSSQEYLDLTQFAPIGISCDTGSSASIGAAESINPITFCCVR